MASFEQYTDTNTGATLWVTYYHGIRYLGKDETYPVIGAPAWCYNCNCLVVAESFMTNSEFQLRLKQLDELIEGKKSELSMLFESIEKAHAQKREMLNFREFIRLRKRGPSCLECNDTNIYVLPKNRNEAIAIPGGPSLRYDSWGFADCGIEPCYLLDCSGHRIREQHD
ncbi:MAG: hypothetical protein U0930_13915 [Pirellulales bacterium]